MDNKNYTSSWTLPYKLPISKITLTIIGQFKDKIRLLLFTPFWLDN
jgi:hypothetical protein